MLQKQEEKHFLNLSGEYGVCSELSKRGINSSITYGNHKAADILVVNPNTRKTLSIEVKTTKSNRIVTGFFQKYPTPETNYPDFWVIVYINKENFSSYYILSHNEMAQVQMERNSMSTWGPVKGVDNVLLDSIRIFENDWIKISSSL